MKLDDLYQKLRKRNLSLISLLIILEIISFVSKKKSIIVAYKYNDTPAMSVLPIALSAATIFMFLAFAKLRGNGTWMIAFSFCALRLLASGYTLKISHGVWLVAFAAHLLQVAILIFIVPKIGREDKNIGSIFD